MLKTLTRKDKPGAQDCSRLIGKDEAPASVTERDPALIRRRFMAASPRTLKTW